MNCLNCQKEFTPKRLTAKFCSAKCRVYHARMTASRHSASRHSASRKPVAEVKPANPISAVLGKLPGNRETDLSKPQV